MIRGFSIFVYIYYVCVCDAAVSREIKQINPPRKSASETREPFRSQVINGAQRKGGSAQRSHWVRDAGDKMRMRRRKHGATKWTAQLHTSHMSN